MATRTNGGELPHVPGSPAKIPPAFFPGVLYLGTMTPKRLNLSLRNLTPAQVEALDNIRRRTGRKTYASAIVRALEDWERLRLETDTAKRDLLDAREALGGLLHASARVKSAQDNAQQWEERARAVYARGPEDPRQLEIPA